MYSLPYTSQHLWRMDNEEGVGELKKWSIYWREKIWILQYADDTIAMAKNEQEMYELLMNRVSKPGVWTATK